MEYIICPNIQQNIIVVSTHRPSNAERYHLLASFKLAEHKFKVRLYETAPNYTVKEFIRGISLDKDAKRIHLNIVNKRKPAALRAQRLSDTTSVIISFDGGRVSMCVYRWGASLRCVLYRKPIDVCYRCWRVGHRMDVCSNPKNCVCRGCGPSNPDPNHKCTPTCRLSEEAHFNADKACKARFKTIISSNNDAVTGEGSQQRGLPAVAAELRRAVRTIFHFQIQLLKRGVVDVPSISPAEPVSEPRLFQVAESERSRSSGPGSS